MLGGFVGLLLFLLHDGGRIVGWGLPVVGGSLVGNFVGKLMDSDREQRAYYESDREERAYYESDSDGYAYYDHERDERYQD